MAFPCEKHIAQGALKTPGNSNSFKSGYVVVPGTNSGSITLVASTG